MWALRKRTGALEVLTIAGLPDRAFPGSCGMPGAGAGWDSNPRPGPQVTREEATTTEDQSLMGWVCCQGLGGQPVARKVGGGKKGAPAQSLPASAPAGL